VLKGDMTLVGPRPEAPEIVRRHYSAADITTLQIPPGVTSPGTLYYYTHFEWSIATDGVVDQYVQELLPAKLALDRVYLRHRTVFYDLRILVRTLVGVAARVVGVKRIPQPPELREAVMPRMSLDSRHPTSRS
jgi:lipopolysaccharide/colanic/teichoic acid biosynthesis glycosyltransferase